MSDADLPVATPDRVQNSSVGDQFAVKAARPDDDRSDAHEYHRIELKDPPGRHGHVFNCAQCGGWYYSTVNFEQTPCLPDPRHR